MSENVNNVESENNPYLNRLGALLITTGLLAGLSFWACGGNYLGGALAGAGLGLLIAGWPKKVPDPKETSVKITKWTRPLGLRLVSLILTIAGAVCWVIKTPANTGNNYHLYAAGLLTLGVMLYALWGNWGTIVKGLRNLPELLRRKTEGEKKLADFDDAVLASAKLSKTSKVTHTELYPKIVDKWVDNKDRPHVRLGVITEAGQTAQEILRAEDNLASAWRVAEVIAHKDKPLKDGTHTVEIMGMPNEVEIPAQVEWKPIPTDVPVSEYVKALPVGVSMETGDRFYASLPQRNFVVAGQSGSGKSSWNNAMLGYFVAHPHILTAYVDLKKGAEAARWKGAVNTIVHNGKSGDGIEGVMRFLKAAVADVDERYAVLERLGVRDAWSHPDFLGEKYPVKVIIVDECSRMFRDPNDKNGKMADEFEKLIQEFTEQARAAGYVLILITQYPTEANLPKKIRTNASDRICFSVGDESAYYAALGTSFEPANDRNDPTKMGVGEAVVKDKVDNKRGTPVKMALMTDAQQEAIVAANPTTREWLDVPMEPLEKMEPMDKTPERVPEYPVKPKGLPIPKWND